MPERWTVAAIAFYNADMRDILYRVAILIALWLAPPAFAADDNYEMLLDALSVAQDQSEADQLSSQIWQYWLTAPDAAAQEVLDAALVRRQAYDFLGAIDHLNRLIEGWPDYAEGWNQRATMYFMRGEFEASLEDVAHVLELEPRHFGALSGKAVILFQQGKIPLAQIAVREALKYHPFLHERAILNANPGTDL